MTREATAAPTPDTPLWKWALAGLAVVPALGAALLHPFDVFRSKEKGGMGGIWGMAKYIVGIR